MAQTTVTTDDLDGSTDATAVEFSIDGNSYSIDLAKKNRAALDKALKPYVEAATVVSRRRARATASTARSRKRAAAGPDLAAVRAWAAEQGIEVSGRGRVAGDVLAAYEAAH